MSQTKVVPLEPTEEMKRAAYRKVKDAIKRGQIIRPESCAKCGDIPGKASDGRSKIHAHHHDYSKPLDVEWLCAKCHRADTQLPSIMGAPTLGEQNGQAKLTVRAVTEIRASAESSRKLAAKYGVNKKTILSVKNGLLWRHV